MGNIHPAALKEFKARQRDSHVWMKKLTVRELDTALDEVGWKPIKGIKLDKHQKVCLLLGLAYPQFAFWLDMGTGKTLLALSIIRHLFRRKKAVGFLILAPSQTVLASWEDEIAKWCPTLPYIRLPKGSFRTKWELFEEFDGGLILATFAGFARMVSVLKERKKKGGRKRKRLQINRSKVKLIAKRLNGVIADEATELGNKRSLQFRVCNALSKTVKYRYELAGRPFGRDPTMLWSQLYWIDRGETLGDTLGLFRAAFFKEKENYWGGKEYKFKKELRPRFNKILRHRSIQYRFEECGTLPPVVPKREVVELPEEASAYYEQFVKKVKARNVSFQERQNSFIRMRQISSGFVGFKDEDSGERAEIELAVNPKLDRLIELLNEIPLDSKWVVFYEFIYSGKLLHQALLDARIGHGWINRDADARKVVHQFNHDAKTRGILASHRLTAFGSNWQKANYLLFYESPVPVIAREQAERRVRRKGQTKPVVQIDMICEGTTDSRILDFHKSGKSFFDAVMKDPSVL